MQYVYEIRMNLNKVLLAAAAAVLFSAQNVFSWGYIGHYTVCRIAEANLTPRAKKSVENLLGKGKFIAGCTWPDEIRRKQGWRHTAPWHYVSIEDNANYFDSPRPNSDVLKALIKSEDVLRDPTSSNEEKKSYLKFLSHFTGDIHQPLHVGRASDRGGNLVKVTWYGDNLYSLVLVENGNPALKKFTVNLHSVWDTLMLETFMHKNRIKDTTSYARRIRAATRQEVNIWQKASYLDWMQESFDARERVYNFSNNHLGEPYYQQNINFINKRMRMGGYRLAGVLNRIFENVPLTPKERRMRNKVPKIAD